jgi:hypothetical protein
LGRAKPPSLTPSPDMRSVEVNDEWFFDVPDLEAAKRVFIDNYDRPHAAAQLGHRPIERRSRFSGGLH